MSRLLPASSLAEELAELHEDEIDDALAAMSEAEAEQAIYEWGLWARDNQRPFAAENLNGVSPADDRWPIWLYLAGRGSGKSRTGAEQIRAWVDEADLNGKPIQIALVGQTVADVRDVMLNGEAGIITNSPPWNRPVHVPANRALMWPKGCSALLFSGDTPDQLRGPQHAKAWVDELFKMQYPEDTFSNLEFGLRSGDNPQMVITSTPRPIPLLKTLLEDEQVYVTRGSSYDNISNLAPAYIKRVIRRYEGTRLGRQELHAEVLTDMPGALWTYEMIEKSRTTAVPEMKRIVVSVDPAVSAHEDSNETGIVVCGKGTDGLGYVLRDKSGRYSADAWAKIVCDLYDEYDADRVIGEVNNGGDLVETVIRSKSRNVSYKEVRASKGKTTRAEPVSALYERNLIKHHGQFAVMEDQMTSWVPDQIPTAAQRRKLKSTSPDRMDAMVWGMTELMLGRGGGAFVV